MKNKNTPKQEKILKFFLECWSNVIKQLDATRMQPAIKGRRARKTGKNGVQQAMDACKVEIVGECVMVQCAPNDANIIHGISGAVLYEMDALAGGFVDYQIIEGAE